jgi:hypothetical protein
VGLDAMVTNVMLRFAKGAKLPVRPRATKANRFIMENLAGLRRELMRDLGHRKLSS